MSDNQTADYGGFGSGSLGRHEALHTANMLAEIVANHLCDHPAIQLKPEWRKMADAAYDQLCMLYVAIGRDHEPRRYVANAE